MIPVCVWLQATFIRLFWLEQFELCSVYKQCR